MDLVLSLDKLQTPVRFHVDLNSELVDPEILPHPQSFPAYDQQDYRLDDFSQDDPSLMLTEQAHICDRSLHMINRIIALMISLRMMRHRCLKSKSTPTMALQELFM
ncbi:hypothetical protein Peur_025623 [Populus x canadensis]